METRTFKVEFEVESAYEIDEDDVKGLIQEALDTIAPSPFIDFTNVEVTEEQQV